MALILKFATKIKAFIGLDDSFDVTNLLDSLDFSHPLVQPGSPLVWSGTLALDEELGVDQSFSLDPRVNSGTWRPGQIVRVTALNPTTQAYQQIRQFRVEKPFYSPKKKLLTLGLTDLLGYRTYRQPLANVGEIVPGTPKARSEVIRSALLSASIPDAQVNLASSGLEDSFTAPLSKAGNASFVQTAAQIAWARQQALWVDENEIVRSSVLDFGSLSAPILSLTSAQLVDSDRMNAGEQTYTQFRSSGTSVIYVGYNPANQINASPTTGTLSQLPMFWQLQSDKLAAQGQSCTLSASGTTEEGDGVTNRTITVTNYVPRIVAASSAKLAVVAAGAYATGGTNTYQTGYQYYIKPQSIANQTELLIADRTVTALTYDGSRRVIGRTVTTYKPFWASQVSAVPPLNGWVESVQQQLFLITKEVYAYTYAGGNTVASSYTRQNQVLIQPVANPELLTYKYNTFAGNYTTPQPPVTFNSAPPEDPGSAPVGQEKQQTLFSVYALSVPADPLDVRELSITTEYCTSVEHHNAAALLAAKLNQGRFYGEEFTINHAPELLFGYQPFQTVSLDGEIYLIDAPTFVWAESEGEIRFKAIKVEA